MATSTLSSLIGTQFLIALLLGGGGLPLGTPPEAENPVMGYVAPEDCLLYASWASMAQPDAASKNKTEQLLAEPEVQRFVDYLNDFLAEVALGKATNEAEFNPQFDPEVEDEDAAMPDEAPPVKGPEAIEAEKAAAQRRELAQLWIKTLLTRSTALYVERVVEAENMWSVEGGALIHAQDAAAKLDAALLEQIRKALEPAQQPTEFMAVGRKFHRLQIISPPSLQGVVKPLVVEWGATGEYLMFGFGAGSIQRMADRLKAKKTPAWLTQLKESSGIARRSVVSHLDLKRIVDLLEPTLGPDQKPILNSLGLRQVTSLDSVSGLDAEGAVSRAMLTIDGKSKGLLSLLDGPGIVATDLSKIPADSLLASAISLDGKKVLAALKQIGSDLAMGGPNPVAEMLEDFEEATGLSLEENLLDALAEKWTMHVSNADGGFTGVTATVQIRDRAKLAALEERLLAEINRPGREEYRLESGMIVSETHGTHPIRIFKMSEFPLPVAPCWCISDEQLILAFYPQAIRTALAQDVGAKSLGEDARLKAQIQQRPGEIVALGYADTAEMFSTAYTYAQFFIPTLQDFSRLEFDSTQRSSMPKFDVASLPRARAIHKHLLPSITLVRRTTAGVELESRQTLPAVDLVATVPLASALMMPALSSVGDQFQTQRSTINLRQLAISMHNFHDTFGSLPAAYSTTKEGKPLLSWRVYVLPFLEENVLYEEFHLDEPWDSDHNKKLIPRMPKIYAAPNSKAEKGKTVYLGVAGKKFAFSLPAKENYGKPMPLGNGFKDFVDGTSNTIMLVEVSDDLAAIWTKPEDFEPNLEDPWKGLLNKGALGTNVVLGDASVRTIRKSWDQAELLKAMLINDGEPVNWPEDNRRERRRPRVR